MRLIDQCDSYMFFSLFIFWQMQLIQYIQSRKYGTLKLSLSSVSPSLVVTVHITYFHSLIGYVYPIASRSIIFCVFWYHLLEVKSDCLYPTDWGWRSTSTPGGCFWMLLTSHLCAFENLPPLVWFYCLALAALGWGRDTSSVSGR